MQVDPSVFKGRAVPAFNYSADISVKDGVKLALSREKNIAIEMIKAEGKPAEMAEKIAAGKMNKFFKDNTLMAQAFVKDGNQSVADYLKGIDADLKVTEFKRVALG